VNNFKGKSAMLLFTVLKVLMKIILFYVWLIIQKKISSLLQGKKKNFTKKWISLSIWKIPNSNGTIYWLLQVISIWNYMKILLYLTLSHLPKSTIKQFAFIYTEPKGNDHHFFWCIYDVRRYQWSFMGT